MPGAAGRGTGARVSLPGALLCVLFLVPRLALLFLRKPFFDELYTRWIGAKPFGGILAALHHDSGPPLYYFLVHALGDPSVWTLRAVSLLFAFGAFLLVLRRSTWGAALLAVYPPAVLLSVDARAYSLCALFVAIGVVALECGDEAGERVAASGEREDATRSLVLATVAFVLAAYTHYYGVLFFPLLLLRGRKGAVAAAVAGVLFGPGFLLAAHQPVAAMGWVDPHVIPPLASISFAGRYAALLLDPPLALVVASLVFLAAAVARSWRFAPYVLVPAALVVAFGVFERPIYFPLRFESVVAVPLMLWTATSLAGWSRAIRIALGSALLAIGAFVVVAGTVDHLSLPPDACVGGSLFIRDQIPPNVPVLASEYCYLYATTELGSRVRAFPGEQALHPGWWQPLRREEEAAAVKELPPGEFVWLGEVAPEMQVILRHRRIESAVELDGRTRLLRVAPDTLH